MQFHIQKITFITCTIVCICIVVATPPNISEPHPTTMASLSLYGAPDCGEMQIGETLAEYFSGVFNFRRATSYTFVFVSYLDRGNIYMYVHIDAYSILCNITLDA